MLNSPVGGRRRNFTRDTDRIRAWLAPLLVAVISAGALHLLERSFRLTHGAGLPEGYRLQDWSSNWLMQTLGLEEMIPFGPRALVFNHIYPPLLDAIRLLMAHALPRIGDTATYIEIDFGLYELSAICFGLVNAIVFLWVRDLTKSAWWAIGATAVWSLMPGYIMLMTLLDPSGLAMLFITASLFFLYLFLRRRNLCWATAFFAAMLLASLSRSVTQIHSLAVLVTSVVIFWIISSRRNWIWLFANIVLVSLMFVVPVKQYVLFATTDTTSFAGYHRVGMLWIDPRTVPEIEYPKHMVDNALAFSSRFNTQENIKDNYRLSAAANDFIVSHPFEAGTRLVRSLTITVPEMIRPSSMYTQNYLVEVLPWRGLWDWMFSSWRYGLMVLGAALILIRVQGWRWVGAKVRRYGWFIAFYALFAAPILLSNRYRPGEEDLGPVWTDAIRQKIFLEVPVIVGMTYALWLLVKSLRGRYARG